MAIFSIRSYRREVTGVGLGGIAAYDAIFGPATSGEYLSVTPEAYTDIFFRNRRAPPILGPPVVLSGTIAMLTRVFVVVERS